MTDNELKPCPFCGGEAKIRRFYGHCYQTVGCRKCDAQINRDTKKQATAAWNKRVIEEATP